MSYLQILPGSSFNRKQVQPTTFTAKIRASVARLWAGTSEVGHVLPAVGHSLQHFGQNLITPLCHFRSMQRLEALMANYPVDVYKDYQTIRSLYNQWPKNQDALAQMVMWAIEHPMCATADTVRSESPLPSVGNRDFTVLSFLLSEGRVLTQDQLLSCVRTAITKHDLALLRWLLSDDRQLDRTQLLDVLCTAFLNVHNKTDMGVLEILLANNLLSEQELHALRDLLNQQSGISPEQGERMVTYAAEENCEIALAFLLDRLCVNIDRENRNHAFMHAAHHGYIGMLSTLWYRGMPKTFLMQVVIAAAQEGHVAVLHFVLCQKQWQIAQDVWITAIKEAVDEGHLATVEFLLHVDRAIVRSDLGALICRAITLFLDHQGQVNRLRIIEVFFSEGRALKQKDLETMLVLASSKGHLGVVRLLLDQGPISQATLHEAKNNAYNACFFPGLLNLYLGIARIAEQQQPSADVDAMQQHSSISNLKVNFEDLSMHPEKYLNAFCSQGLPDEIVLINPNEARRCTVDIGGVTRETITLLFESLLKQKFLEISAKGLPLVIKEKEEIFTQIGHLISLILEHNSVQTDPILTGYLFHESFLGMVQVFATTSDEQAQRKKIYEIMERQDPSLQITRNFVEQPTPEHKVAYLHQMGEEASLEQSVSPNDTMLAEAQEYLASFYRAAQCFYNGMTQACRAVLGKIQNVGALSTAFQGEPLTLQSIFRALHLTNEHEHEIAFSEHAKRIKDTFASGNEEAIVRLQESLRSKQRLPDHHTSLESPSRDFLQVVDWLLEYFALMDETQMKKLFFAITGQTVLHPHMTITLEKDNSIDASLSINTCYNVLHVPSTVISYRALIQELEMVICEPEYNIL